MSSSAVVGGNADAVESTGEDVVGSRADTETETETEAENEAEVGEAMLSSTSFYVGVGVVAGVLMVVVVVAVVCYLTAFSGPRRRRLDHVRRSRFTRPLSRLS